MQMTNYCHALSPNSLPLWASVKTLETGWLMDILLSIPAVLATFAFMAAFFMILAR